jgi:hypothetical protein
MSNTDPTVAEFPTFLGSPVHIHNICILFSVFEIDRKYVHWSRGRACKGFSRVSILFVSVIINKMRQDQVTFITPTSVLLWAPRSSIYQSMKHYATIRYCQVICCYCLPIIHKPNQCSRSQLDGQKVH